MSRREQQRRFERLAAMQRLARDLRREELGQSREATDARVEAEARALGEQVATASAIEATFAAPRLCVDRMALAARQFHVSEAALADAHNSTEAARQAEDDARASLNSAEHRLSLVDDMIRAVRRKRTDKRDNEAILQAVAMHVSRRGRP
jgi:hypothetical protein